MASAKRTSIIAADEDDHILSMKIGGRSIGDNLEAALSAGHIVRRADGKFELAKQSAQPNFIKKGPMGLNCKFRNHFMFEHIYRKSAVPISCRNCYKVKVLPGTLRQLMTVKEISESFPEPAKSGTEVAIPDNQNLYATYFYTASLDKARSLYKAVRAKIDAHPKLGPAVRMIIKRGCTNYERNCGPSDRYTFDPQLAEIEDYFFARFVKKASAGLKKEYEDRMKLIKMVALAFQIGDETYKDFTGGKNLYPPVVTYPPEEL